MTQKKATNGLLDPIDPITAAMIERLRTRSIQHNINFRNPRYIAVGNNPNELPPSPLVLAYQGDQLLYIMPNNPEEITMLISDWEQWDSYLDKWVKFNNVTRLLSPKGTGWQIILPFLGLVYDVKEGKLKNE